MKKINNKEIQDIEINITKELLAYINDNIDIDEILHQLDFISPFIQDESSRLAFNVWLSMDYTNNDGKTFIENFLEAKSSSLTSVEKQILKEKSNSHVSLFQVLQYEDEYMHLLDVLSNREYKLLEPHLNNVIHEGEFLFTRVGKLLGDYTFIGDLNYLPSSIKPMFLGDILRDFNNIRKDNPQLTIEKYLKRYSLNIYKIYREVILDIVELDEDIHSYLFDELEEFEGYLLSKNKSDNVQYHLPNLVNLFEYYLSEEDMTLYDLDQLDLQDLFHDAIEDNFINSQEELNSYIKTLKDYLSFLNNKDDNYRDAYLEMLDISENRFYYMNLLNSSDSLQIDQGLVNRINSNLNDDALTMIMDYEKFLLFMGEDPVELTAKNRHIKRKNLLEINDLLEFKNSVEISSPNQKNFPLIHFFYYASLNLALVEIMGNNLMLTSKGVGFLRLKDKEKYSILFKYLWSEDFVKEVLLKDDLNYWQEKKIKFINVFSKFKINNEYNISNIFSNKDNIFSLYHRYLKYFGLIDYTLYMDATITMTNLGKRVFDYLDLKQNKDNEAPIILLDNYRGMN